MVHQNAANVSEILNDVLSPHPGTLSLHRIIEDVDELRKDPYLKGVRIHLPNELPSHYIKGRRILIRRMMKNLLLNAQQHGAKNVHVNVNVVTAEDGQNHLKITVSNDGKPIPAEILPQLGNKFATFREGGTGLGLHFVRKVVQYHGGQWHPPLSNGAKGATFSLTLPIANATRPSAANMPKRRTQVRPLRKV